MKYEQRDTSYLIVERPAEQRRHGPYSKQRHDRYESEAVRNRLTMFSMASAVKSCIKILYHL